MFVRFVAVFLFGASEVVFMFSNHHGSLKFTQKLVSELFGVSILCKIYLAIVEVLQ